MCKLYQDEQLTVCLMNDAFPPIIDGVSNVILNYAEIINKKLGHSIVATPSYPGIEDNYSFPVVRYPSFDTTKLVGYRTGFPFLPHTVNKLKRMDIDIIHTHCPIISTFLARSLRSSIDVPVVFTYHTKFDIEIDKALDSDVLQSAAKRWLVSNIEACDAVWVVSSGAGENLRSLGYEGSYTVMENGVDYPAGAAPSGSVSRLRHELSLTREVPIYLFVGRMMWYKGIKIILDGLAMAKAGGAAFKMVFVGDGADFNEITAYATMLGLKDECIFTGAIHNRSKLRSYFTMADLFLFPSTFDTNGIVVREAAACGLASVLIKNSCASDGVLNGHNGILIDENPSAMKSVILAAGKNRHRLREIGSNAMNELYISWDDAVASAYDEYYNVLDKYMSRRRARKTI